MWRPIISALLMIVIMGYAMHDSSKQQKSGVEYWQVYFVRNGDNCDLPQLGESIEVRFEDLQEKGLNGVYRPLQKEIVIDKPDTDTIAHESYHATMDILRKYDLFDDEEYGAYMVGSLVECIENIKG